MQQHATDSVHESADLHVRALHVRAVRDEVREADFICSTDALDSYDEVVDQSWDLGRYLSNPVVLWAHNSRELPIGKARNVGIQDGKLQATITFASAKANPMAEMVWQSVLEQTLRAVSVGFRPREVRVEKRDGRDVVVMADNELFEISVTPIPANPEALAKMKAKAYAAAAEEHLMDDKSKAALEAKEAELADIKSKLAELDLATAALSDTVSGLTTERDAAVAQAKAAEERAERAETALVEAHVDALVGKKLLPAERDAFVELAKSNRPLFEKMVASRSDLTVLHRQVPADPAPPQSSEQSANGDDLAIEAERLANAS